MKRRGGQGYTGVPAWVYALAVVGAAFIVLPLLAIVAKVNWAQFFPLITSESSLTALGLSMRTSAASTVLCVLLGVPLALVLARSPFPGQRLLRAFVLLPLVLPPVVGGIALLYTFGRQGLLGKSLELAGVQIAFSTTAVVLAQTFVALPFLVVSLEGALRTAGSKYEAVAATLGAGPGTVLRRVTVPLVLPGLASGAVLSFARSSVNSAPPSRSPEACKESPVPCPLRSTSSAKPTPTPPSPCPSCWLPWPSPWSG